MQKFIRKILVRFGIVFSLVTALGVNGTLVFGDSANSATAPAVATGPAATPAAMEPGSKNSVLLFHFLAGMEGYLGGYMFEDGTTVVFKPSGGAYQRIDTEKTGKVFSFILDPYDYAQMLGRSKVFELKQGMVAYTGCYGQNIYWYVYREHAMKGIPVIASLLSGGINYQKGYLVRVRPVDASVDFAMSSIPGKDKIVKIPVTGAKSFSLIRNGDGYIETVIDSFDNPVPLTVTEPYTFIQKTILDDTSWTIIPPVLEKAGIELSAEQIKKIMALMK